MKFRGKEFPKRIELQHFRDIDKSVINLKQIR